MTRRQTFSRNYNAALRNHLRGNATARASSAHRLGREATTLRLETRELAHIHREALRTLNRPDRSPAARARFARRAREFYATGLNLPARKAAAKRKATLALNGPKTLLAERTSRLVAANLRLRRGVVQHKTAEKALKKSGRHCARLLRAAHQKQEELQRLTHRLLSDQEVERSRMSHDLHDEVAQTLLGINVRLLTLEKMAGGNTTILRKEIASTQRVVKKSVKAIDRLAREMNVHKSA